MAEVVLVDVLFGGLLLAGLGGLLGFLRWDRQVRAEIRDLERRIREATDRG